MSNSWSRFFISIACMLGVVGAFGQPKFNSPYSRLGLGDLANPNFASLIGMGNLSAAMHDAFHVNLQNPASLGHLRTTAFEVGVNARYAALESPSGEQIDVWSGNLAYLSLGFPLKNQLNEALEREPSKYHWGMNLALLPYTTVGYDIETIEQIDDAGQIRYNFEGSGGTYKLLWGNGVRYKNLSLGVNLGYLFGNINRDQTVTFDSLVASYRDEFEDDINFSGFFYSVGAQYDLVFKKPGDDGKMVPSGKVLTFGAYVNPATGFSAKSKQFYVRRNIFYSDLDTIVNEPILRQDGQLPLEWHLGITYRNASKFRGGIEISQTTWSNYENDAKPENLKDTWQISAGAEFIPDIASYNSYGRRMRYRIGAFYGTDPRSDEFNIQLTNYGITLGLGFPIILPRQQTSFVNVAFELGRFGSDDSLQETYGRMTVGFTLNDNRWFFKRKFY